MVELTPYISILMNLGIMTVVGLLIRSHFAKLKSMEKRIGEIMPAKEIRDLIDAKVDDRLELIKYILDEIKADIKEIKHNGSPR